MNQRLTDLYQHLAQKERSPFLQNHLTIDAMWEKPIDGITSKLTSRNLFVMRSLPSNKNFLQ